MKVDVFVARPPAVVFGFMGVQIVQDDVPFALWVVGDEAVHEVKELDAPAAPIMAGLGQTGGHIERGEQGRGPVAGEDR